MSIRGNITTINNESNDPSTRDHRDNRDSKDNRKVPQGIITSDDIIISDGIKIYICKYCNAEFTCKQHRWRHLKTCYLKPSSELDIYKCVFQNAFHEQIHGELKERQNLLLQIIKENNPLLIFKTIYLIGNNKDLWPVARLNDRYRYLNRKRELVEDNGENLIKYIYTNSHRSLIHININIIKEQLKSFSYIDYLYNNYDLKSVQNFLHQSCYRPVLYDTIKQSFNSLIDHQTHPFFKNMHSIKIY